MRYRERLRRNVPALLALLSLGTGTVASRTAAAQDAGDRLARGAIALRDDAPDDEYVTGPGGLFHRSCVTDIPNGAHIAQNNDVFVAGRLHRRIERCAFKPRQLLGQQPFPSPHGVHWRAQVSQHVPPNQYGMNFFNSLNADWRVPPLPSQVSGQTLYFFNSLVPARGGVIAQPVLELNGGAWGMRVWYIHDGAVLRSPLQPVTQGQIIVSRMSAVGCTTAGICTWLAYMWNSDPNTRGVQIDFRAQDAFTVASHAVFEAWNLSSCAQLPRNLAGSQGPYALYFRNLGVSVPGPGPDNYNYVQNTTPLEKETYTLGCNVWPGSMRVGGESVAVVGWNNGAPIR